MLDALFADQVEHARRIVVATYGNDWHTMVCAREDLLGGGLVGEVEQHEIDGSRFEQFGSSVSAIGMRDFVSRGAQTSNDLARASAIRREKKHRFPQHLELG
jgi:hypothetical protein